MIDIHCHLLPRVDDGPQSLQASIDLAWAAVEDGVTHAVVTPHVYPGRFNNTRSSIELCCRRYVDLLKLKNVPLRISFGGEVRLDADLPLLIERDEIPFLGVSQGFKTMLLEFPDAQIPLGADRLVRVLLSRGIRPLIAHPERNKSVMENPERIRSFVDAGCALQITAGSILGQFGPRALAASEYMLSESLVSAIASDAHNLDGRRYRLKEARQALVSRYGEALAVQLTELGPASLCGLDV
ncbi:tyrosine-protein phosphatase [Uliginosibacterium sediminicola]|uniref:protein-tyrosine-phosphatase n=1 Tax=Uliginosibacterium sediminicola TaxID=2024550 RepID=A0ABU9YZV1_9RHOO